MGKPYKPRAKTIDQIKTWIPEYTFTIKGIKGRFVNGWFMPEYPKIVRRLIADGFLDKKIRFGTLLKEHGLSWDDYWNEQHEKWAKDKENNRLPLHHNVSVHKIFKDITEFFW